MSVLKSIVDKKNKGEIKSETLKYYKSEIVGEEIEFEKKPLSHFLGIVGDAQISEENIAELIPLVNRVIFEYATMFRNPDDVKAAMEAYPEAKTPADLPELIFESNMTELFDMFELVNSFYEDEDGRNAEVERVRNDIKN